MQEFEKIYREYFTSVYRYMRRLTGDERLAEDITSDAFFKALNALDKFRGDCDIRIWLCRIARNLWYDHLKKSRRSVSMDEIPEIPAPDAFSDDKFAAQDVRRVMHDLPEPYKEVFMWRTLGEMSHREIAAMFGKSENWACVVYHRARAMIKTRLEEMENER